MISAKNDPQIAGQTFFWRVEKKCLRFDRKPSKADKRLTGNICINSPSKSGTKFPDQLLALFCVPFFHDHHDDHKSKI